MFGPARFDQDCVTADLARGIDWRTSSGLNSWYLRRSRVVCGGVMIIEEKLSESIQKLPPSLQQELLDFVEFLLIRAERREMGEWTDFSITSAMQGMEDEEPIYTLDDLKVVFR
ncbi:MAG: DUF2281 domain-containing protein [Acidobacteria bacterium]|nr:DUF2281 domain-containing protein [Acidobacteriota bacterium]